MITVEKIYAYNYKHMKTITLFVVSGFSLPEKNFLGNINARLGSPRTTICSNKNKQTNCQKKCYQFMKNYIENSSDLGNCTNY